MPPRIFRLLRPPLTTHNAAPRHLSLLRRPPPPPKPSLHPSAPLPLHQRLRADARTTLRILLFLAAWYPAWSFLTNHVISIMSVTGPSMAPFLNADYDRARARDWVVVRMWWGGGGGEGLERGAVVVYRSPMNPERYAVKRVVALEGDVVLTKAPYPVAREEVPFGHVWVEGDQLDGNKTMDSNLIGPVSKSLIVGRVDGVVWPWRKAGRIRWEDWRGSDRVLVGQGTVEAIEF